VHKSLPIHNTNPGDAHYHCWLQREPAVTDYHCRSIQTESDRVLFEMTDNSTIIEIFFHNHVMSLQDLFQILEEEKRAGWVHQDIIQMLHIFYF